MTRKLAAVAVLVVLLGALTTSAAPAAEWDGTYPVTRTAPVESTTPAPPDPDEPGGVQAEVLARGSFPDEIDARFRMELDDGHPLRQTSKVDDAADTIVVRVTFEPGGSVGWHTHPGPAIVTVVEGELTIVNGKDCVPRVYEAGEGLVNPGQGSIHNDVNATDGTTVAYVTLLDVPEGEGPTTPVDAPSNCDL